jgi:CheY-like chemotaxis protein
MPGMNGLELTTWLKQRHPTLPVIMVSGSHPELEQMAPFVDAAMGKVFHYGISWTGFKSCLLLPESLRHPP